MAVNVDIQRERNRCSFKVEELTNYLDGGPENTKERREDEDYMFSNKELFDEVPEEYMSHKERYENDIRKNCIYFRMYQKRMGTAIRTDLTSIRPIFRNQIHDAVFKDNSPFSLQTGMFIPAIMGQASQEQQDYWLTRAKNMEILGTYAQTELGHGTFLRGLETTATYDVTTEEFILHSPTLTSYKWWPGNLGHTSNYCVVMAQLYIKGKNCGIQPFMVQLRDEETHMPLPGIKLGEIGTKLGFNGTNNGFLGLDHHRIKRDRMLMKNAQVLKDGTFVAAPHSKLAYGTMIFVRVIIVASVAKFLARAATISIRYSAVRRQSQLKENEPECQVLDYVSQQHKIFIALSTSYAFSTVSIWLWDIYIGVLKDMESGKLERLPELHAVSCCLKAVSSLDGSLLVDRCRSSCGGHGFIKSSNLPQLFGLAAAAVTYEGEYSVLMLQTARALQKSWNQFPSGEKLAPTFSYFSLSKTPSPRWDNSISSIVEGFQRVAIGKVETCRKNIAKLVKSGVAYEDAWNKTSVQLVASAEAHCRAILLSVFASEIERTTKELSPALREVLLQLMELYLVYWTLEKTGDLLLYTKLSGQDVQHLQERYELLLEKIRPNAVGLVDAFDLRDESLHSTLGSWDGRVYERLMEEALKSPLNKEPVNESFHKYLKPFMQGKL